MMRPRHFAAAACLALVPALAQAEGFYTSDLGDGGAPAECMARAGQALNTYATNGASPNATVSTGTWSVDAYNLQPGNVAVSILCPYRESHVSIVLLVAHSAGTEAERIRATDGISQIWNGIGQSGGTPGATK